MVYHCHGVKILPYFMHVFYLNSRFSKGNSFHFLFSYFVVAGKKCLGVWVVDKRLNDLGIGWLYFSVIY